MTTSNTKTQAAETADIVNTDCEHCEDSGHGVTDTLLDELLSVALEVSEKAGALVLERLDTVIKVDTKSSATDFVTEVDKAAEDLIVTELLERRSDDSIIGEEGAGVEGSSGISWIIDPIDGTTSFVYGQSGFSISVAAYIGKRPLVGVVYAPALMRRYWAAAGRGAHYSTAPYSQLIPALSASSQTGFVRKLQVSSNTELSTALVGTGLSYLGELRALQSQVLSELVIQVGDIRRIGSAAIELCMVAAGQTDGYYEHDLSLWDYAAGILIASEAGAKVEISSNPITEGAFICASTPAIFDGLSETVGFK